jgi:hypothetical protein
MDATAKTQITIAAMGLVGVIGAALIANWVGLFGGKPTTAVGYSTTCKFTVGPRAGSTQYYPPNAPGLTPAVVGGPCTDGAGSIGYAIPD